MSAHAPELPQIDIGLGILTLIGESDPGETTQFATIGLESFAFEDNVMAARKIGETFHGKCIHTVSWANGSPCFVFTMKVEEKIKDPFGLLKKVRRDLQRLAAEVKLLAVRDVT